MKYHSAADMAEAVISGQRRALAKAITLIESERPSDRGSASLLINTLLPATGNSIRLGITGPPGVGKSTFIEALGVHLTEKGHKVAVLTIDPSSSLTGGSILADKTRMERLSVSPSAFIRPSPSAAHLGGVARKTRETMLLCEAAGYDVVLVETVGVGQSEIAAASLVDFFLVLMLPDAGDELQGIKKGVLEFADAIAVNKAEEANMDKALRAKQVYLNALQIVRPHNSASSAAVFVCSAHQGTGIEDIWKTVEETVGRAKESGHLSKKRKSQEIRWMETLLETYLKEYIATLPAVVQANAEVRKELLEGGISADEGAKRILETILERLRNA